MFKRKDAKMMQIYEDHRFDVDGEKEEDLNEILYQQKHLKRDRTFMKCDPNTLDSGSKMSCCHSQNIKKKKTEEPKEDTLARAVVMLYKINA